MPKFNIKTSTISKQARALCFCCHGEKVSPSPSYIYIFKATRLRSTDYLPAELLRCSSDRSLPDTFLWEQTRWPDCLHLLKHSRKVDSLFCLDFFFLNYSPLTFGWKSDRNPPSLVVALGTRSTSRMKSSLKKM